MAERLMLPGLIDWLAGGWRGVSSNTMVEHLTGYPAASGRWSGKDIPHDPDDLNRCLLLLEAVPLMRPLLPNMASCSHRWAALVERWDEIERCFLDEVGFDWCKAKSAPKTYKLMREVIEGAEIARAADAGGKE